MSEVVKEILDIKKDCDYKKLSIDEITILEKYITNLQKENERLKARNKRLENNQVKTLNKIRDYISMAKCEIMEGYYSNDKHSQYWSMFKEFAERLNKYLKNIIPDEYVAITKAREKELLDKEFELRMASQEIKRLNNIINKALELSETRFQKSWYVFHDELKATLEDKK